MSKQVSALQVGDSVALESDIAALTIGSNNSNNSNNLSWTDSIGPSFSDRFTISKIPYYKIDNLLELTSFTVGDSYPPWTNRNYYNSNWNTYDDGRGYVYASFTTDEPGFLNFNLNVFPAQFGQSNILSCGPSGPWIRLYCLNDESTSENSLNISAPTFCNKCIDLTSNGKIQPSIDAKKFYVNYENYLLLASTPFIEAGKAYTKMANLSWTGWVEAGTKFVIVSRCFQLQANGINDIITITPINSSTSEQYLYYTLYTPKLQES